MKQTSPTPSLIDTTPTPRGGWTWNDEKYAEYDSNTGKTTTSVLRQHLRTPISTKEAEAIQNETEALTKLINILQVNGKPSIRAEIALYKLKKGELKDWKIRWGTDDNIDPAQEGGYIEIFS